MQFDLEFSAIDFPTTGQSGEFLCSVTLDSAGESNPFNI